MVAAGHCFGARERRKWMDSRVEREKKAVRKEGSTQKEVENREKIGNHDNGEAR